MSVPVVAVHPISLKRLSRIISTTTTCIGSPFVSSKSCSQQLIRSPKSKRLPMAKDKLDNVLQSMDEDIISLTKENISKLKYVAKSCTCSEHQPLSADFAYHWLASSRLVHFLNHMSWSTDTANWKCLAPGNLSCTSMLDCFSSTELHDKICGFLNRMAIGAEADKSLLELARYWLCGEHQGDNETFMTTVDRLWQECRIYWSSIGVSPRRKRAPDLKAAETLADLDTDSSQADSSIDFSLISDSSDTIDSTEYDNIQWTIEPSRISQPNTKHDAGQQPGNHPPWNDLSICEDDREDDSPGDTRLSPFQSTQSPGDLRTSDPSLMREISDKMQLDRVPGTFPDGDSNIGKESAYESPCQSSSTGELPAPGILQTQSKNANMENKQSPAFKPRGNVSNETAFNETFKHLRNGLGCRTGHSDGYIYIFQSKGSPSHFKIGLTTQTILQRAKQVARCAGDITPVTNGYNICRVPQHKWLEQTIFHSLASWKTSFICPLHKGKDSDKLTKHHEWIEVDGDANEIAEHVDRWRRWMGSEPYDKKGDLFPRWQRRIDFFVTSHERYRYLLGESSPCRAWSIFLDPPWWIRIHMTVYQAFLRQRGKLPCRWTQIRENWMWMHIGCDAAAWSAVLMMLLLYAGYHWVSNPMMVPLIYSGVVCILIWQH